MKKLTVGDRIRMYGGYDMEPPWLRDRDEYFAVVLGFFDNEIEGRADDERLSAAIEFEEEVEYKGIRGKFGHISGRWEGQTWESSGVVHVHLSDTRIESAAQHSAANTVWLESHASYEVVDA